MDFDPETKRIRLATVHPGVTVQQVLENSGFDLIVPKNVPTTDLPTSEELELLRAIDPTGIYIPRTK
jgi:glutaconate CoA-transferase subunit B